MNFSCGHAIKDDFHNFGRGEARKKRISAYASQSCLACRCAKIAEQASKLTHVDGTSYTLEQVTLYVDKWNARVKVQYLFADR